MVDDSFQAVVASVFLTIPSIILTFVGIAFHRSVYYESRRLANNPSGTGLDPKLWAKYLHLNIFAYVLVMGAPVLGVIPANTLLTRYDNPTLYVWACSFFVNLPGVLYFIQAILVRRAFGIKIRYL